MGNVVDYVRSEFRTFGELEFSNVDSLVLSELSYMCLSGLVPAFEAAKSVATVPIARLLRAEDYPAMFASNSGDMNDYRLALLRAVCESPRFRGLRVGEYAERLDTCREQQFAAMTFDLGDCSHAVASPDSDDSADSSAGAAGLLYVAFRGTDGTLVGWKEDFNMAVRCPVPSQESAYRYVDSIMERSAGFLSVSSAPDIMIGGHSKGGNMAAYAAILPPLECPPIMMSGAEETDRNPAERSMIESTYRYADSCDGTGQRTAMLKSSFHPTSVPSVPRKATYSNPAAPADESAESSESGEATACEQSPRSNVIAANCCSLHVSRRSAYSPTRSPRNRGDSHTARSNASR